MMNKIVYSIQITFWLLHYQSLTKQIGTVFLSKEYRETQWWETKNVISVSSVTSLFNQELIFHAPIQT